MKYFRYEIKDSEVHLYPIVCWHIGAKQSSAKFIAEVIRQIKEDPKARWLYMGDGGECVTKTSKGNIYEQLVSPGEQLRIVANLLTPIRDKGIGGIRGNHGNRVDKDSGLGWDETLCARIGIPYLGVSCLGELVLGPQKEHPLIVSLYAHHGSASAITPGGKMNAAHKPAAFILADVLLTAHTHACGEVWPSHRYAVTNYRARRVEWKTTRLYVCGSAYDSRGGYAEEKMYPPLLPEHLVLDIKPKWIRGEKKEGLQVPEISHRKIEALGAEFDTEHNLAKWRGAEAAFAVDVARLV